MNRGGRPHRQGWERLTPPGEKLHARWRHVSGWQVVHCGHPTANWPWFIEAPDEGTRYVSPGGRGFMDRLDAMRFAELGAPGCRIISEPRP